MPLHPSQVFENADTLVDRAINMGESYQSIAAITGVNDSTVRNWYRRKRAKLSIIQPLIDYIERKEKGIPDSPDSDQHIDIQDNFNDLIKIMTENLKVKIKQYISGERERPPLEDAQLITILKQLC